MNPHKKKYILLLISLVLFVISCNTERHHENVLAIYNPSNILDYTGTPSSPEDRNSLMFSDQGAWFAYGFSKQKKAGFSGPFLMTQEQGVWCSDLLSQLELTDTQTNEKLNLDHFTMSQTSYNSHLEQCFKAEELSIKQTLFFPSAHSALITTQITNLSNQSISLLANWRGKVFLSDLELTNKDNIITLKTPKSSAKGVIQTFGDDVAKLTTTDASYNIVLNDFKIEPNATKQLVLTHTFIFPNYNVQEEQQQLEQITKKSLEGLKARKNKKQIQLSQLYNKLDSNWQDNTYKDLIAKSVLTLQNNTRIAAGGLKHAGIFPSYHYEWFQGFRAWDSWKHAVAVAHYNPQLAKDQIQAMYDFQFENGFIPDCIFRDTTIEKNNYRNTKPPLSAWAVWKVYEQDKDLEFIKNIYPKIVKQHQWWYRYRDYDQDGICEYGSTDGTLKAAKWESGMDNAVRFDNSNIIKSSKGAFSLDQESVDLNAYLYAEKQYLQKMAKILEYKEAMETFSTEADILKTKIQSQFFDKKTGWFYDTSIDGKKHIDVMGCEGWIPLWANVATVSQAEAVKNNMINPKYFNTKVPFQTLSASHPKFKPNRGYWRGPNWLDQAYFGVVGLHNYNYDKEAYDATFKLMQNAEGVLSKGISIKENYQPITGEGLESQNFSWSAAHYLLLLINE